MNPRTLLAAAVLCMAASSCSEPTAVEPKVARSGMASLQFSPAGAEEVPVRYLVVFKKSAPKRFETQVAQLGGTVLVNHAIGVAVVEGLNDATAAELQERTRALYVVRDAEFRLLEPAAVGQPELTDASMAEPLSSDDPTTALGYGDQWNMRQIHADQAWAAGRLGSSAVTVAILDTGIDYMLPDLVGLVDLDRSASFEPQDDAYAAAYFPSRDPSTDLHFHGTNVATQVASNAWAFAGVTSRTTLLSVKVCSFMGGCHGVYQGILWAIDHGADVINMSLGGWFVKAAYPGEVMAYNRLMNYAAQKGVTVVVAAGNDGDDLDRQDNILVDRDTGDRVHLPSFFNWFCEATQVICVSATRRDDEPASYTNYGSSAIDVAAPGGDFYSDGSGDWVYALCPQTSLIFPCADGYYPLGVAGTSQAAPHVAGLAALAVEDVGRAPARVKAYIRNSADPMGGIARPWFGRGRINVAKAVGAW